MKKPYKLLRVIEPYAPCMFKCYLVLSLLILCSANSFAGFRTLTWHSRANCGNNESITWWAQKSLNLLTYSKHIKYSEKGKKLSEHWSNTGWEYTWRSARVCWGEGTKNWEVKGQHYMKDESDVVIWLGDTKVTDCDIYNGWWDQ